MSCYYLTNYILQKSGETGRKVFDVQGQVVFPIYADNGGVTMLGVSYILKPNGKWPIDDYLGLVETPDYDVLKVRMTDSFEEQKKLVDEVFDR